MSRPSSGDEKLTERQLVERFRSPLARVRDEAVRRLRLRGRAALPVLLDALKRPHLRVRHHATVVLLQLGRASLPAAPLVQKVLEDRSFWQRALAHPVEGKLVKWTKANLIMVLYLAGPAAHAALPVLRTLLRDRAALVRSYAVQALAQVARQALPVWDVLPLLKDTSLDVRLAATRSLGVLSQPSAEVRRALTLRLSDPSWLVAQEASAIFQTLHPHLNKSQQALLSKTHKRLAKGWLRAFLGRSFGAIRQRMSPRSWKEWADTPARRRWRLLHQALPQKRVSCWKLRTIRQVWFRSFSLIGIRARCGSVRADWRFLFRGGQLYTVRMFPRKPKR